MVNPEPVYGNVGAVSSFVIAWLWTSYVLLLTLPGEPTSTRCYIFIDRLFVLSSTYTLCFKNKLYSQNNFSWRRMFALCGWFLIVYRSKYIHIIERHLQRSLNTLSHWADTNGFKFSSSKTVIHFCKLRNAHPNPELKLNGTPIPVGEQTKFLGVIFDNKLTFLAHIRYLKEKCLKALNLLRVVAQTFWGTDQHTLLHLVRSKLDYGSVVYGSAQESYLRILDPIQNHALLLCLGAFRTSPAWCMCVQATEPPLYTVSQKKVQDTLLMSITSRKIYRFPRFFHW